MPLALARIGFGIVVQNGRPQFPDGRSATANTTAGRRQRFVSWQTPSLLGQVDRGERQSEDFH